MTCLKCNGEMVIWEESEYGTVTIKPCPKCNKNNEVAKKAMEELEKIIKAS